jgi:hypothetical protein
MRNGALVLVLLLPALARAQDTAVERDPVRFVPRGVPIFVEVDGVSAAAATLARSPLLAPVEAAAREKILEVLRDLAGLGIGRAVVVVDPGIIFATRFALLAEAADPAKLVAAFTRRIPDPAVKIASGEVGPFFAIADGDATLATLRAVGGGKEPSLRDREDFAAFAATCRSGAIRFHLDLKKLAPFRPGLNRNDDAGAILFASHVLHVAKTARTLSGCVALDRGAAIGLTACVDRIAGPHAFTESRPVETALAPPPGCAARLTLNRDLAGFWNARETLLRESARAPLAEFRNNLGILMGGLSVEDVFEGLDSGFDLYVCRGDPRHAEGRRYPAAALVALARDPALAAEFPLSFQTTIGIVNAQRATEGQPRFFQESTRHRDVLIASARILSESVPDPSDERLQLEPSLAVVKGRVIFGSSLSITRALVDQALDGRTIARSAGDEAEVLGQPAAALVADAAGLVRARMLLDGVASAEAADERVAMIRGLLSRVDRARLRFDVDGTAATLDVGVEAPTLFPRDAPESR